MLSTCKLNLVMMVLASYFVVNTECRIKNGIQTVPPMPKFGLNPEEERQNEVSKKIDDWSPKDGTNVWELSGLTEGDIQIYDDQKYHGNRNAKIDQSLRWINSTVPFHIIETDYTDEQIKVILEALDEFHNKTCVRFRPYEESDKNFVVIKGNTTRCSSSIGMHTDGQMLYLRATKCVHHGTVIHELLHALGFVHQQNSPERDDYVIIHKENILSGTEHNFKKYNTSVATNFNVSYDYNSVMHYSEMAFSKNGKRTIEPLQADQHIGQRNGLSEKDILKLNAMYEPIYCHATKVEEEKGDEFNPQQAILSWFE